MTWPGGAAQAGITAALTVRMLARARTGVIWRCWQAGTAYDPDTPLGRS